MFQSLRILTCDLVGVASIVSPYRPSQDFVSLDTMSCFPPFGLSLRRQE